MRLLVKAAGSSDYVVCNEDPRPKYPELEVTPIQEFRDTRPTVSDGGRLPAGGFWLDRGRGSVRFLPPGEPPTPGAEFLAPHVFRFESWEIYLRSTRAAG